MSKRATEGAQLGELVCLALPACRLAERQCSRRILGRPPRFSDTVFSVLIMVAVLQRRKSKSAQYRYLMQHRHSLMELLSLDSFPCRSTYFLRYQRMHSIIKRAVEIQGRRLIRRGVADAHAIAVDKTLVASQGRCWHQRDRKAGKAPPVGVDLGGQWGYSEHRGWVFGYGANIAVSSGKNGAVCPLWISVDPANVKEQRSVVDLVDKLPAQTQYVVTDRGYDSNELCERIENSRPKEHGGRRFVCRPQKPKRIAKRIWRVTAKRILARQKRQRRERFTQSILGKKLLNRRSQTIEPFNQWFKSCFDLNKHAWHRGLENNQTQMSAAILSYQVLLLYNAKRRRPDNEVQWILDGL